MICIFRCAIKPFSPPFACFSLFLAAVGDSSLTFTLLAPKKPYKEPNFKCSHNNNNNRNKSRETLPRTRTCHGPSSRLAPGPVASFGLRPGLETCLGAVVLTQPKSNSRGQWSKRRRRGMRRGLSVLRRHLIACGISKTKTQISRIRQVSMRLLISLFWLFFLSIIKYSFTLCPCRQSYLVRHFYCDHARPCVNILKGIAIAICAIHQSDQRRSINAGGAGGAQKPHR